MAKEQVVQLFRTVQVDPILRDRLNASPDLETFVKLAQQNGYDFTLDEWKESTGFAVEELECELSEIPGL